MIKPKLYITQKLSGTWLFTRKLDGVRMLRNQSGEPVSRADKPLYNLENISSHIVDAEIFLGSWEETVGAVRRQTGGVLIQDSQAFTIEPLDSRLVLFEVENPTAEYVEEQLQKALKRGDEGLVIYQGEVSYKVKPRENHDVIVTGFTEGKGKYSGLIGALETNMGKVSGMTDQQRADFTRELPEVIEVGCMGLTKNGKFRHPRFIRVRFDKPADECS